MGLVNELFYKGEYAQVLQKTYDSSVLSEPQHLGYVIGSLSFLGRVHEAEALYTAQRSQASDLNKVYSRFFLALGWTRRSQYEKAKKFLLINKTYLRKNKNTSAEVSFLVQQGISFFLYFLGQFEKSISWNEKSLASAIAAQNLWMRALAHDLLANNLIQNGRIYEGLRHFAEAAKDSEKINNKAIIQAIEISSLVLSCEYGIQIKNSFARLAELYAKTKQNDAFSRANLGLELARQYTLKGQWTLASDILNQIGNLIFEMQNRRQEARYNLRWAELYYLKNELNTALHYIRSGRRCLELVDHTYEMQFLGLEKKIHEEHKNLEQAEVLEQKLAQLSLTHNNIKNNNILSRGNGKAKSKNSYSDDEIHHMLTKAQQSQKTARKIILETEYFSWMYRFFNLKRGQNYILLNLQPKSLTIVDADGFTHKPSELSTLNYKILNTLSKGYTTKEELLSQVWGYQYDPLRHDSLIYSTLSTLRKILSQDAQIIETSEMGYNLKAKVLNLLEVSENDLEESLQQPAQAGAVSAPDMQRWLKFDLNSRQMQIMQLLTSTSFVSVKQVVKMFKTSEITANRDLRSLFQKKLVLRIGQGRSTQYMLDPKA